MQTLTLSVLSTEFVQTLVTVTSTNAYNPTSDTVSFALTNANAFPAISPGDDDWNPGVWVTYPGPLFYAQVLVGPENGGVALSQGRWQAWLRVTDSPAVPVKQPFLLQIA